MAGSSSSTVLALAVMVVLFASVLCVLPFSFKIEKESTTKMLSLDISYTKAGDSLAEVELRQHGSEEWMPLKKLGNVWTVESSKPLQAPFNFRFVTTKGTRRVYDEVIPTAFKIGSTYIPE